MVWVLFQRTFQLVRLEALLEVSKLTISFLKGLLVALCIFKLNCKQRLIKETVVSKNILRDGFTFLRV